MGKYTQDKRAIAINTPLGKDVLLLKSFKMVEEMGRPFVCQLDLRSENAAVEFDKIVGENVSIRLNSTTPEGKVRYINGHISRFVQDEVHGEGGTNHYRATLVPWLWFLTRTQDCRIFQQTSIPDIIKKVFEDLKFAAGGNFEFRLTGTYKEREYVVQYRESAFNFVSRLMEHEGIYYFFEHEDGKHLMVITDSPSKHKPNEGYDKVVFSDSESNTDFERLWEMQVEQRVQPGKTALVDYDFKAPTKNLYAEKADPKQHPRADYEVYDYPGNYIDRAPGETYAKVRNEEQAAPHKVVKASGDVRNVTAGAKFTLEQARREDQNAEYLCIAATCSATVDEFDTGGKGGSEEMIDVDLTLIPAAVPYRTPRTTPKPRVGGPQTAVVVGPSGEEIHTDEFSRVKVHFFWDRVGKADENASCWIRVSHPIAGKKWGAIYTPRIGQEVIVDFLEGDPDQPIITGRVYNQDNMPPYALPASKTMSTFKSNSSVGGGGFNELRFEDKAGEEQVFIHAQKNMDTRVLNDYFLTIMHDRHEIVENDYARWVKHDQASKVDNDTKTEIGNDSNLTIKGKSAEEVMGSWSVKVDGNVIEQFGADHSHSVAAQLSIKADKIVLEAGTNITLKVGDTFIALDSSSLDIETKTFKVKVVDSTHKADASVKIESISTEIKASASLLCDGGVTGTYKGMMATLQGSASTTVTGGAVAVG